MSRCYLDTNFLYTHLRSGASEEPNPIDRWRWSVSSQVVSDGGVISAPGLDELAYRLTLAWLRDDGAQDPLSAYRTEPQPVMRAVRKRLTATWKAVDSLALELWPTDHAVVGRAQNLMAHPGLSPRDAFHAAHALASGCSMIASADPVFEQVPDLTRLGP